MVIRILMKLSADNRNLEYSFVKKEYSDDPPGFKLFTEMTGEFIGTTDNPDYCNFSPDLQKLAEVDPDAVFRYEAELERKMLAFTEAVAKTLFATFSSVNHVQFVVGEPHPPFQYANVFHRS